MPSEKTMSLENYYNQHLAHLLQHENHREKMTSIILSIAGLLIGLITFSELAIWSLFAAITVTLLGAYGFIFAGKHYERQRFHGSIMIAILQELDDHSGTTHAKFLDLRNKGAEHHYNVFKWPGLSGDRPEPQASAKSWIAKQHLHPFWEAIHILIAAIGLFLSGGIITIWMS